MIGEADEARVNSLDGSPQKHSILSEVPPERNAIGDDNGTGKLNKDDQNANPVSTLEDSDDDEPVFRTKSHKKAARHILEDSDSEQEDSGIPASRPEDDDASDGETAPDDADKENLPSTEKKKKRVISHSDSESDKSDDEEAPVRPIAFTDSEDSGHERGSDEEDKARSDVNSDEDSDDDPVLTEALRQKIAKGAAKKAKSGSTERQSRKAKTDAMTEIHAETQRLVRESEIRLPYHRPQPLGLSAILARAQHKQEHLTNLKKAWKTPPSTSVTPDGTSSLLSRAKARLAAKAGASPSLSKPDEEADIEEVTPTSEPSSEVKDDSAKPQIDSEAGEENNDMLPDITRTDLEIKSPPVLDISKDGEDEQKEDKQEEVKGKLQATTPRSKDSVSKFLMKTSLTPKLANLGVAPRLSGGPDSFIDLDDDSSEVTPKPGVKDLMDRLVKHSASRKRNKSKEVEMSTVQKVKNDDDREELKLTKFTVHLEGDGEEQRDPALEKPGAKLLKLKENLAQKMKAKREEARQERYKMYELDNEEGFVEDEEEAELTDGSDTDAEPEEEIEEEEEEAMDEDEYTETEKEEHVANPFFDDEAEDDDDDNESNLHLALEEDDTQDSEEAPRRPAKDFLKSALLKTNTLQLFDDDAISQSPTMSQASNKENIEVSDRPFEQLSGETIKAVNDDVQEDEDTEPMELDDSSIRRARPNLSLLRDKEVSVSSADNSFDTNSLIPAGQGTGKKNRFGDRQTPELYTPSSKSSMGTVKSLSKMSDLALPIEDTQDLLGSPLQCSQGSSTPRNSFNFHGLDDSNTESHLLDEDGLIKTGGKKATRRQLMLETNSDHDDDELLGLCSGQFTSQAISNSSSKANFTGVGGIAGLVDDTQSTNDDDLLGLCSGRFTSTAPAPSLGLRQDSTEVPSTQSNMDELIGLCSGQFSVAQPDSPVTKKKTKRRKRIIVHEDDDADDFEVASPSKLNDDASMDQDNMESDEELGLKLDEESDEEEQLARAVSKKKMRLNDFVDKEAELSGSEYDSDENYDIDEKDDVMEACSGDEDDLSDSELRDQVGRVHMKTVIDEDKKAIRLMQEMYLPDGDLYSDGGGRVRRFRWKNIDDDDTQQDMFNNSDDEEEEDTLEAQKWRLDRHEREKFLLEQQKEAAEAEQPASQVIKLGKVAYRSKKDAKPVEETEEAEKKTKDPKPLTNIFKVPKSTHGSFLSRGKDTLAKIAEMTKPISTNINGPRHSRSFLFSTMDKDGDEEEQKKPAPARRSLSHPPPNQPASKKPRLEKAATVPSTKKSIFDHLGS